MRKEGVLFGILFLFLILGTGFTLAVEGEAEAVEDAYACLENTIETTRTCSEQNLEEQIISLLTVGKCKDEVLAASNSENECWPKNSCDLRLTALATLALDSLEINTTASQNWMLDKKGTPTDLDWFLEVDTEGNSSCTISYDNSDYSAQINEDETVSIATNTCLSANPGYWFEIATSCYDEEFTISCDEDFVTTLLFKKNGDSTWYILDDSTPSDAQGETYESIDSSCFQTGTNCDYSGSLWASIVLDYLFHDVNEFIPYLLAERNSHPTLLPESFLYKLTGKLEFRTEVLEAQINDQYWKFAGDQYYDSAVALLPFQGENPEEKENTKEWLIQNQEENGCFVNQDIRRNGWILYSIWPDDVEVTPGDPNATNCFEAGYTCVENASLCDGTLSTFECETGVCCNEEGDIGDPTDPTLGCEESGYFCMAGIDCGSSNLLYDYDCSGLQTCCSVEKQEETCFDLGGTKCNYNEYCSGGVARDTDELAYGEVCCIQGNCEEKEVTPDEEDEETYNCEANFGVCEPYSCDSGYSESFSYSCQYGDLCCVKDSSSKPSGSYWWVWVLFILIVLVVVGIMFRDKIQEFFLNRNKGKGSAPGTQPRRGFPPSYPRTPQRAPPLQRRMPAPSSAQQRAPIQKQRPVQRSPKELDDVLKKLKNMSE